MKTKQQKRKEALIRLQKNISLAEKHREELRRELKEHQQSPKLTKSAKPTKPKSAAEALLSIICLADLGSTLRSSIELNERHLQRMKRDEQVLRTIVYHESHQTVL